MTASSCNEIYQRNPTSRGTIGQYWMKTNEGTFKVTCNMKLKCGGVEGGWIQVVDVDMNRDDSCPGSWYSITTPKNLCLGYTNSCNTVTFNVSGIHYKNICGQAKAYQKGITGAFYSKSQSIDSEGIYVDGIQLPWQHHVVMCGLMQLDLAPQLVLIYTTAHVHFTLALVPQPL